MGYKVWNWDLFGVYTHVTETYIEYKMIATLLVLSFLIFSFDSISWFIVKLMKRILCTKEGQGGEERSEEESFWGKKGRGETHTDNPAQDTLYAC